MHKRRQSRARFIWESQLPAAAWEGIMWSARGSCFRPSVSSVVGVLWGPARPGTVRGSGWDPYAAHKKGYCIAGEVFWAARQMAGNKISLHFRSGLCWQPNDNIKLSNLGSNEILWPYYLGIQHGKRAPHRELNPMPWWFLAAFFMFLCLPCRMCLCENACVILSGRLWKALCSFDSVKWKMSIYATVEFTWGQKKKAIQLRLFSFFFFILFWNCVIVTVKVTWMSMKCSM